VHVYVVTVTNPNLPSALYLPTGGFTQADDTAASIELRNTDDGKVALVAFSSLAQLTSCCGKDQPWVLVSTKQLPKLHAARPYDVIVLDTPLPRDLRHTGALV
jgi:hypothetical protein